MRIPCRAITAAWVLLSSSGALLAQPAEPPSAEEAPADPSAQDLVPPKLVGTVAPTYPEAKRGSGESATVLLNLVLDGKGKVTESTVVESAGLEFDRAAQEAAEKLSFEPATKGGNPIPAKIAYRFNFTDPEQEKAEATGNEPPVDRAPVRPPPKPSSARQDPVPSGKERPSTPQPEAIEIEVEGERPPREPTKRVLDAEEIAKMPGTNGDALRSLSSMPGVARPPGMAGMLLIRGSGPRDTQTFVEGTNVPLIYHFGGVSSVIPSELLERIDFYPGNFGPEFGRAMGGIVDVGLRSPRSDRIGGLLQIDTFDARTLVEGPLNSSTRFVLGARRSWVDAWLGPVMRQGGLDVVAAPVYYDYQAMVEHDLTRDNQLRLSVYGSDDRMALTMETPASQDPMLGGDLSMRTRFIRGQAALDTRIGDRARWRNSVSVGADEEYFTMGNVMLDIDSRTLQSRSDFRVTLCPAITAVTGLDVQVHDYDVVLNMPALDIDTADSNEDPLFGRPYTRQEGGGTLVAPAAYALLELTPLPGLKLMPGIRADYHEVTDRLTADPRLGVRYDVHSEFPRTTLKGGVGRYRQPPEPYEAVEPFGTPGILSSKALHTSLGVEQELLKPLELSVEGFYKDLEDLVVAVPDTEGSPSGFRKENIGSGYTYGSEFLLRYKPEGAFFGWIAYTLSRSVRRDAPDAPEYLFDYDQTHILTALGSLKLGRGWQLGARFRYVTGSPYTPYVGGVMDYDAGAYSPVLSSERHSRRVADFHQLDVRVDKTWTFESWKLTAYLDVQNAYNRQNVEAISYNYNFSETSTIAGLPILPIAGVRGEL